jgi:hypothetical protein
LIGALIGVFMFLKIETLHRISTALPKQSFFVGAPFWGAMPSETGGRL